MFVSRRISAQDGVAIDVTLPHSGAGKGAKFLCRAPIALSRTSKAPAGAQEMLHCVVTRSEGLGWKGFYCAALTSRDTRRLSPEHAMRTQGSGHWVWVLLLYVVTRRGDLGLQGVELCGTGAARHTTPKPRLHWHALGRLWPLGFGVTLHLRCYTRRRLMLHLRCHTRRRLGC